jgi:SPP1 gp7 family putative phage head morphogenesis protein
VGQTRRVGRQVEKVLTRATREGFRIGLGRGIEAAINSRASELLHQDYSDAEKIFRSQGFKAAVPGIEKARHDTWIGRWGSAMHSLLSRVFEEVTKPSEEVLGARFTLDDPEMAAYLKNYVLNLAGEVTATTRDDVTDLIRKGAEEGASVPELAARILKRNREITPGRSQRIANTELHAAQEGAAWLAARASGVVLTKTWETRKDERVRREHRALQGAEVGVDEEFPNGSQYPRDPNCRCQLTFGVDRRALRGR